MTVNDTIELRRNFCALPGARGIFSAFRHGRSTFFHVGKRTKLLSAVKRFTQTEKWRDPWFRKLTPTAKHLWQYLLDHCDISGVVEIDFELASFQIGEDVNEKHLAELGDRIETLPNGKLWIPKFIPFQFGILSENSRVHAAVVRLLEFHKIPYANPVDTLKQPLGQGVDTPKDKDKDKDKEKEGIVKGEILQMLKDGLCGMYDRSPGKAWNYMEESALVDVARRDGCVEELADLRNYQRSNGQYFPKSIKSLLAEWDKWLDHASSHRRDNASSKPKTLAQKEAEACLRQAQRL